MKSKFSFLWLLLFVMTLTSQGIFAQTKITGNVKDATGLAVPGATVVQEKTSNGVLTDSEGNYAITLKDADSKSLVFSFIGFISQTVPYTGNAVINIVLKEDKVELNEVVVMGYTSQKKSSLTGAVGTVKIADLEQRRVPDLGQALQGQIAGVQVTSSTGAPGDEISIRIRGEGTIGNNSPLFIVDGIPSRDINFLNPSDIQTMTALKDAAAAAIYGSRASAGVIVITTKSGSKGKASLDINYYAGIQKVANLPTMLNSTQYMNKMEETWNNSGYTDTNPYTADKSRSDFANTDWLHELFELGKSQNLQLSTSGGTDKIQFLISGGYYSQDGIVVYNNDKYQRYNFRTNINANITDRFTIGTNLQLSNTVQDKISSKGDAPGVIRHAFIRPPVISVYKDKNDPNYTEGDPYTDLPFYSKNVQENGGWNVDKNRYELSSNPLAIANFTNDKRNNFKTFGNVYAEYAFLKDKELKLRTNLGIDLNYTHNKAFNQNYGDNDGNTGDYDQGTGRQNRPTSLSEDRGQETIITWNNTLNYSKLIDKHSISALAGSEYITNYSSSIGASRNRFEYVTAPFQYLDFGGTQVTDNDGNSHVTLWNGGGASEWALFSVFGSVNYNYDSRYFLTGSIRGDASSRFAENNQWGYFPSVSVGWRISEEKFMQNAEWISDLKLRASTGKLGNQEIGNYTYLTLLRREGEGYVTSRYGNPDLKWETTKQDNIGLDLGLFKNKIYLSADYFKKTTSGILLPVGLNRFVGDVLPTVRNSGIVVNKGFELALAYKNNDHAFKYNVNANMATVTNMVEQLHPNLKNISTQVSRTEVGHPLNSFYGLEMIGIYQNQNEINSYLFGSPNPGEKPGDIKFKDLDNNGLIDENDRTFIGNPNPRFSYGLNFSASFKGFDFSVLFQGVEGVERYNDLKKIIDYDTRPFNHSVATLEAWHGEGTSNTMPRSTFNDNGSSKVSSIFVEDASYLRLKNIEIGYTLSSLFGKSNTTFQNVRIYVSAQNLFTVTNYTGLDPESADMFDQGTYPQSKAFLFGVNIKL